MNNESQNIMRGQRDIDDETFLKGLGNFIKSLRIAAGFPSIKSFVDTIDMSYSQYQGYESGRNITMKVLKRILGELNLSVGDWLKIDISNLETGDPSTVASIREARISQVIEQVEILGGTKQARLLRPTDAQRYVDILIHCHTPKTRSYILKMFSLDDSYNTFKRVAGKLIDYGWLDYTDRKSKNSPTQSYYTTEAGKRVLRLTEG